MSEIDELYTIYDLLNNAKEDCGKYQQEYCKIISAAGKSGPEKILACQFISCFFKNFPDLMNEALNAHLDLCEDPDPAIRKVAIKCLPDYCKDLPGVVPRISAILTQMLLSEDPVEYQLVQESLCTLFNQYPKSSLTGLLDQIGELEPIGLSRALKFINARVMNHSILSDETFVDIFVNTMLKVYSDNNVGSDLKAIIWKILTSPKLYMLSKSDLGVIVTEQMRQISLEDVKSGKIDEIKNLIQRASKLKLPGETWENVVNVVFRASMDHISDTHSDYLSLLRLLTCSLSHVDSHLDSLLGSLYSKIIAILPDPPKDLCETSESLPEGNNFNWDYLEVLLFCFQYLYFKYPSFMSWNVKDSQNIENYRKKLRYLHRIITDSLRNPGVNLKRPRIVGPGGCNEKTPQPELKGPKSSIVAIIKVFLHIPPATTTHVPDWLKPMGRKSANPSVSITTGNINHPHKRIEAPEDPKPPKVRASAVPYVPPGIRGFDEENVSSSMSKPKSSIVNRRRRFGR
ncbi:Apoptosis inhibitor 5-A [Thelohanellus kitauei]|uniref:Apoptosis inhibitor 5-A n=1 Tax=Thelohanellus kitauei TaxID=669202 RepID=A0A0C2J7Z4_THEKT|nr:Apoptosis inhibitor 5-A [Thelohanellus kitauei]